LKADGTTPVLNIDTTNKRLGVGTTAPFVALHSSDGATVYSGIKAYWNDASDIMVSANQPTYGAGVRIAVAHNSTVTSRPVMTFIRTRGTLETPADVQLNDNLGDLLFGGWGGTGINYGGGVFAFCDGTPSAGATPTRLSFVTGSNSGDRAERLKISADGTITVAGATTFSAATTFTANPTINASTGTASQLTLRWSTSTVRQRLGDFSVSPDSLYLTSNLNFDGSNWQRDDVNKSGLAFSLDAGNGTFLGRFRYALLGANPATLSTAWQVSLGGVFQVPKLGAIADSTTAMQFFKADGTTAVMTIDTTNSRLGIGVAAPTSKLHISQTDTTVGGTRFVTATYGIYNPGSDDTTVLYVVADYKMSKIGAFSAGSLRGFRTTVENGGAGNISTAIANQAFISNVGTGTIADGRGYYVSKAAAASNPITTMYGIYMEDLSGTGVGTAYGVYQLGASVRNHLAGNLGVGIVSAAAKIHAISTTEQLRLGYDANNYAPFTVNSGGLLTITPITNGTGNTTSGVAFTTSKTDITATTSAVSITSTLTPTATLATYRLNGLYNQATIAGAFNVTAGQSVRALQNQVNHTGAGTVVGMAAFTNVVSQTGTGTITNAYGGYFIAPVASATNPITNYYPLYLESPIVTGITTPYSIYSAGGNNYFGGNVGIGTTAPASMLEVSQSGSTNPMLYTTLYGNTLNVNSVVGRAARGTSASPTAVQTGDTIAGLAARGYGATGFASGGRGTISIYAAENWTDSVQGTYITFSTTPIGSTTLGENLRISSAGLSVGTGAAASAKIHALATTEQLRLGYDASNYLSATVASTGSTTFALTGTTPIFTFSQGVTFSAGITLSTQNIVTDTTTGTKIGTATNQKIGFFNATPIVQVANTTDLGTVLSDLGLRAAGTAYPITTSGAVQFTGGVTITTANLTLTDKDIVLGTTTGTKFGTATDQKLAFFNSTPVVQQTGIAALKIDYTAGDLDTEAEIITAINATNTAINALRTALNALGLTTTV
jgi:hypothetical protein